MTALQYNDGLNISRERVRTSLYFILLFRKVNYPTKGLVKRSVQLINSTFDIVYTLNSSLGHNLPRHFRVNFIS